MSLISIVICRAGNSLLGKVVISGGEVDLRHTKRCRKTNLRGVLEQVSLILTRQWPRRGGRVDWRQSHFRLARFTSRWIGFEVTGRSGRGLAQETVILQEFKF